MTDFDELKQTKAQCLADIREALPLYANRLNSIDERLMIYIEDAISNEGSHANLYELLGKGCQFQYFGYDPYQSKDPINTLKAYLQEKGVAQPDKYVIAVSQRNAWFNAPTDDLARAIKSPIPYITFSANPMWPWLFGNCVLSIDGKGGASADMDLGNKKPVKRNPGSDSCKVDPIQCICVGLGLMTEYESKNH